MSRSTLLVSMYISIARIKNARTCLKRIFSDLKPGVSSYFVSLALRTVIR